MNRKQYLDELSFLLSDISDEERKDALSFYEDYFDEAGIENEAKVILELGEPSKVAAIIRDSIKGKYEDNISSGDHGFDNVNYQRNYEVVENKKQESLFDRLKNRFENLSRRDKALLIALVIILVFPVTGILLGTLELGSVIVLVPLAIIFSGWIIALVLMIAGIGFIVGGVLSFFSATGVGLGFLMIGFGIVLIAISDICFKIAKWIFKDLIPKIFYKISSFFHKGVINS